MAKEIKYSIHESMDIIKNKLPACLEDEVFAIHRTKCKKLLCSFKTYNYSEYSYYVGCAPDIARIASEQMDAKLAFPIDDYLEGLE